MCALSLIRIPYCQLKKHKVYHYVTEANDYIGDFFVKMKYIME